MESQPEPIKTARPVGGRLFSARRGSAWALLMLATACLLAPAPRAGAQKPRTADARVDPAEAERLAPVAAEPGGSTAPGRAPYDPAEAQRFRTLRQTILPEGRGEGQLRIRALDGFIDYDEEEQVFYGPGRTQIWYGKFYLEGDRVILDNRLQEIQAEGNVILRTTQEGMGETEIHASSMRYNFAENEGVGFDVSGQSPPVFFRTFPGKDPSLPPLQQVGQNEILLRNAAVTTCNFKVPHYSIRAGEVILFTQDRIFFRGAVLRVWNVPVFYMPFFSRSLREASPWYVQMGVNSRTGFRLRVGYEYHSFVQEPTFKDEDKYEIRSDSHTRVFADMLSSRGLGAGSAGEYFLEFGKHVGEFQVYGIEDLDHQVSDNKLAAGPDDKNGDTNEAERYQLFWKHRSRLTENLSFTGNVDWFSDPDLFYDILDLFADKESIRERVFERRARFSLTYLREAYVLRLMTDMKDRIGLNRYNDYSDPAGNNQDFDIDPGVELKNADANGISRTRWGRVAERYPQATAATRYLPFRGLPLFYMAEFNAYNNLDKGFNTLDGVDDSKVVGFDFYNQLLYQYRITERYVLLAKLGAGVGVANRSDSELGLTPSSRQPYDALNVIDDDGTFLIGTKKHNLDDINPLYALGDAELRFNARFSDALTGFLLWRYRETTSDFIGDFYANAGDVTSRADLYDYRLRRHIIQGNLNYRLIYPQLYTFMNAGWNLESQDSLFPNEDIGFWNVGGGWSNRRNTFRMRAMYGWRRMQLYSPSDPRSGDQDSTYFQLTGEYVPIHGRWYVKSRIKHETSTGQKVEASDSGDFTFFTEEGTRDRWDVTYGRQFGPKWNAEMRLQWDSEVQGLREMAFVLERDLHDAIGIIKIRTRQDITSAVSRSDNAQEMDISFGLKVKLPQQEGELGPRNATTLFAQQRQPVMAR